MKTHTDLPEHVYVRIEDGKQVAIYYSDSKGRMLDKYNNSGLDLVNSGLDLVEGIIAIEKAETWQGSGGIKAGNCSGAWIVAGIEADQGWGPLLYDIAMEWATINGNGLVPDRHDVSPAARKVWNYYFNNRSDVKNNQLDDLQNTLTEPKGDNCDQRSASDPGNKEPNRTNWKNSPLSKIYTKQPTIIGQLKKENKLIL